MRKFFLENEIGEKVSLSDKKVWLNNPEGLGVTATRSYETIMPGFFEMIEDNEQQTDISGTLMFLGTGAYQEFRLFSDWVYTSKNIKLGYCPYSEEYFYKDVHINILSKSEKKLCKLLECSISISPLTPWYSSTNFSFQFSNPSSENYKRYPYKYIYRYAVSRLPGSKDFSIDGHYPGEVELRAEGPLMSPVLTLANTITGELYGKLDLNTVTIEQGETLYYSSRKTSPGVWVLRRGKPIDIIDKVELSAKTDTFFHVPANTKVTATMTVNGLIEGRATMNIFSYYKVK